MIVSVFRLGAAVDAGCSATTAPRLCIREPHNQDYPSWNIPSRLRIHVSKVHNKKEINSISEIKLIYHKRLGGDLKQIWVLK